MNRHLGATPDAQVPTEYGIDELHHVHSTPMMCAKRMENRQTHLRILLILQSISSHASTWQSRSTSTYGSTWPTICWIRPKSRNKRVWRARVPVPAVACQTTRQVVPIRYSSLLKWMQTPKLDDCWYAYSHTSIWRRGFVQKTVMSSNSATKRSFHRPWKEETQLDSNCKCWSVYACK